MKHLKSHVPTMLGIGFCLLVLDVLIFLCRVIGMAREAAIYMGVLGFVGGAAFVTHLYYRNAIEEEDKDDHA